MSNAPLPPPGSEQPSQTPQPVFDPQLFPPRHRPWRQWFMDHNPCLLLSTVLMLAGCYLVNSSLQGRSDQAKLIGLLAAINVYEACIIPLGLVLIRRSRGTARDGMWLLLFESLFLVNGSFINVDFGPSWSVPFNLALYLLALVKVAVILHGLKIGLSWRTFGFFALQLALIYGMPVLFAEINVDGVVSPRVMYALWWVVGLLPVVYDQLGRFDDRRHAGDGGPRWDLVQQVIRRVYVIAPWVMLVAHLSFSHWAHHSPFEVADVSPALLGLAIAVWRARRSGEGLVVARVLPLLALLLAFGSTGDLSATLNIGGHTNNIASVHFALAGVVLSYGYMAGPWALACCAASLLLGGTGYFFQSYILAALRWSVELIERLIPSTAMGWGIAAIAGAFSLLGAGTILALNRTALRTERPPLDPVP